MANITVRFAPSPTGHFHVGNMRAALLNFLFVRQKIAESPENRGTFILRFDDTDQTRVKPEFIQSMHDDLAWLGMTPDVVCAQSEMRGNYAAAIEQLKATGRLYPCFETPEELGIKRKTQRLQGLPPLYDRAALSLTAEEIQVKIDAGQTPHWRFKLNPGVYSWHDLARGPCQNEGRHTSDPVLLRENGDPVYTLTSVIDDINMGITHIIRGEDHVSNTMVQLQLFEALGKGADHFHFAHLPLIVDATGLPFSKRAGSYSVREMRDAGIMPLVLLSYLEALGTARAPQVITSIADLQASFDLRHYARSTPHFDQGQLSALNSAFLQAMSFSDAKEKVPHLTDFTPQAWQVMHENIHVISDITRWHHILRGEGAFVCQDKAVVAAALEALPEEPWDETGWQTFLQRLKAATDRKGKALFMPLRMALTGLDFGPKLPDIFHLMGAAAVRARLTQTLATETTFEGQNTHG